jgi:hypothetical protein
MSLPRGAIRPFPEATGIFPLGSEAIRLPPTSAEVVKT